jgi:ABC-2 type transport system permease protein
MPPDAMPPAALPPGANDLAGTTAAGAIYDLGYRRYDGPRLGRWHAISTLFWSSLRAAFGMGRSGRAKIVPWGLAAFALIPALVSVAIVALIGEGIAPFTYDNYLWQVQITFAIFVAAQAPELVNGDMRHRVLALYFSHPLERLDYAAAKLGALVAALLLLALTPQLVLFVGNLLASTDVVAGLRDEIGALPQILGTSLLYAVTLAAIGIAIAAFTPRRAYATGAIIAFFLVTGAVSTILGEATRGSLSDWAPLIDPFALIDGTRDWLLGATIDDSPVRGSNVPLPIFGGVLAALVAIAVGVIALRYRRVEA